MGTPALMAWSNAETVEDLWRFFRAASRLAGARRRLDYVLLRIEPLLRSAARTELPRPYRALLTRRARRDCWHAWRLLVEYNYATREGHLTEAGVDLSQEIAGAATIDGGLGRGLTRGDRIKPVDEVSIPSNEDLAVCCGYELRVPAYGEAVVLEPNPVDGWDVLMEE